MISHVTIAAFEDELSKIAMDQEAKDKLKRFGIATLGIGIGTGLGIGAAELAIRAMEKKLGPAGTSALKKSLMRYGIPTATGLASTIAMSVARRSADKYIDQGAPKKLEE